MDEIGESMGETAATGGATATGPYDFDVENLESDLDDKSEQDQYKGINLGKEYNTEKDREKKDKKRDRGLTEAERRKLFSDEHVYASIIEVVMNNIPDRTVIKKHKERRDKTQQLKS